MWQTYISVTSLNEAASHLARYGERARIIAGGTDLLIELERGQRPHLEAIIDISRVPGLADIREDGDDVVMGPLVLHNHIVNSPLLREGALPLAQACWEVGAPQIRNRATLAGNLITASPANDTISPFMAMDTRVTLISASGVRTVPLAEFYTGLRRTVMRPDEVMSEIRVRRLRLNERGIFLKLGLRRAQAISVINVTAIVGFAEDGETVVSAALALGCVAPTIIRLPAVEAGLMGKKLDAAAIRDAAYAAAATPTPIDDVRGSAEYRVEMIRVLVARALTALARGEQAAAFPAHPPMLWGALAGQPAGLSETLTHDHAAPIVTHINGQQRVIASGQDKTLLRFLREDAGLPGTKEGCAEGECGACTVFLDGAAVMACMVPAPRAHGASVVTVEGLKTEAGLHPVQQAFIDHAAVQCGYCTPGLIMAGARLIDEIPSPTREQAAQSITGNLCRCTGYYKIVDALLDAAAQNGNGSHA
jgi:xanthine dehydrogenase iron-sulfur cluster and FAD-binding subunit A